ncbi:hypothetical protein EMIT036CA2_20733 [Chryseobacterium sp. IT-36CA2]
MFKQVLTALMDVNSYFITMKIFSLYNDKIYYFRLIKCKQF